MKNAINILKQTMLVNILIFNCPFANSQSLYLNFEDRLHLSISDSVEISSLTGLLQANNYREDGTIYQTCKLFFKSDSMLIEGEYTISVYDFFHVKPVSKGKVNIYGKYCEISMHDVIPSCQNIFDLLGGEVFRSEKKGSILEIRRIEKNGVEIVKNNNEKLSLKFGDVVLIFREDQDRYYARYFNYNGTVFDGFISKSGLK